MGEFDLIVVGAGPAGTHAALTAASAGMKVALFDANLAVDDAKSRALAGGKVSTFFAHTVWSASSGYRIDAVGPRGTVHCTARALIVAAGATELVVPFEGWTLPGVFSLAATANSAALPGRVAGRSLIVAGCGPLLAAAAANTIQRGGKVEAIVDLAGAAQWMRALPALATRPGRLMQRLEWWRTIWRARTPRHGRCSVIRVEQEGEKLRATLARCDAAGRAIDAPYTYLLADGIAVGHGFTPASEITRVLRARHRYSRRAGGWIADVDEDGRTSCPMLYVAGDAAGIMGADAAADHGALVGLACALDLDAANASQLRRRIESARRWHQRSVGLARAMAPLTALRSAHVAGISAETLVCRCEAVSRAEIDAACEAGAHDMNQLKAWTRCGMGSCQGRICGDIAAELLMHRVQAPSREAVGCFTARTPLRPVTVESLTGNYEYADIAIPSAAPL